MSLVQIVQCDTCQRKEKKQHCQAQNSLCSSLYKSFKCIYKNVTTCLQNDHRTVATVLRSEPGIIYRFMYYINLSKTQSSMIISTIINKLRIEYCDLSGWFTKTTISLQPRVGHTYSIHQLNPIYCCNITVHILITLQET